MLDLRLIREQPDFVKAEIAKLYATAPIDDILRLDELRRALLTESETLKAERNEGSRRIPATPAGAQRDELVAHLRAVGDRIAGLDAQVAQVDAELQANLLQVPNLPDPDVPVGRDESENVISEVFGALPTFAFAPKPHWDLAQALGIIDFERGVKISGSRFYLLRGAGARLQRALISWFLDTHGRTPGLTEVYPPVMVREPALVGTGNLPKFGDALYRDEEAGLWLIPTAEVPVTNMYGDEILDASDLPIHHFAYSACFRREQFSSGRDVRGIKRGHQFDKVEIVKFVHPDTSNAELEALVETGAALLAQLGIAYRKVQMCTGDLSFVAAKKIDLEAWAPGCGEWLEVSSCSNFRDFQARRANIRFRPADGGRPQFAHTLNGSALALPRTLIAVLENNQQEGGSITVPDVLRPYLHGVERITPENAR